MKKIFTTFLITCILIPFGFSQTVNLIPYPTELTLGKGTFQVTSNTTIMGDEKARAAGEFLAEVLSEATNSGLTFTYSNNPVIQNNTVTLLRTDEAALGKEGYRLEITPKSIFIRAHESNGFLMAIQTMRQLMPKEGKTVKIPALTILDTPEFAWRGMLFDVGRHFFSKDFIMRYIDLLSFYKMNVLHWHLTEDQGWRIEIKKYPELTRVGAWRTEPDGTRYGGFYTQEEIREVVAYAQSRGVEIVPEIEMPGHSLAALTAYPELSCTGGPFEVANSWGVFEDVYCPGKENTFRFLEDVLTEVIDLFPSKYIHIGGDECPKDRWMQCPDCQRRIKEEGLEDEAELQSYFIKRIEHFLNSKGKNLTGWDETLEGGLAPNATVQVWREWKFAEEAASQGHDVVMSPTSHCYFDGSPERLTLEKVYTFYPVSENLPPELAKHILGAECCLWSEHIDSGEKMDYRTFPRILALSEILWNGKNRQRYAEFHERVTREYPRLQNMGVKYSPEGPVYTIDYEYDAANKEFVGKITRLSPGFEFRYTLDGSNPVYSSPTLQQDEFRFKAPAQVKVQSFQNGYPLGLMAESQFIDHLALGAEVTFLNPVSSSYPGKSNNNLCDGMLATESFSDGYWQGINYEDLVAIIDMKEVKPIQNIALSMLTNTNSWILFPFSVNFEVSENGTDYTGAGSCLNDLPLKTPGALKKQFGIHLEKPVKARYIKVTAKNPGLLPEWHRARYNGAWIFFDEVVVR